MDCIRFYGIRRGISDRVNPLLRTCQLDENQQSEWDQLKIENHGYNEKFAKRRFVIDKVYYTCGSRSWKKSRPKTPLLSLNRSFLFIVRILAISSSSSLKSPSKLARTLAGVLDLESTEWPWVIPQAVSNCQYDLKSRMSHTRKAYRLPPVLRFSHTSSRSQPKWAHRSAYPVSHPVWYRSRLNFRMPNNGWHGCLFLYATRKSLAAVAMGDTQFGALLERQCSFWAGVPLPLWSNLIPQWLSPFQNDISSPSLYMSADA